MGNTLLKPKFKKVLIITGPTSSGKTLIAERIALRLKGDIISADSRQVYTGMDIGTGKDMPEKTEFILQNPKFRLKSDYYRLGYYDLSNVRIWGLDIAWPDQEFSASHYYSYYKECRKIIISSGRTTVVCGGTGLYVNTIISPPNTLDVPRDNFLRKRISGLEVNELKKLLLKADEEKYSLMNNSDINNPRRLIRAIEVATAGKVTAGRQRVEKTEKYLIIGLKVKGNHEEIIKKRIEKRVNNGLLQEITGLLKKGYSFDLQSMSSMGYREWKDFFSGGKQDKKKIVERWVRNETDYARRQMVYLKKIRGIKWFFPEEVEKIENEAAAWYTH